MGSMARCLDVAYAALFLAAAGEAKYITGTELQPLFPGELQRGIVQHYELHQDWRESPQHSFDRTMHRAVFASVFAGRGLPEAASLANLVLILSKLHALTSG